MPYFIAIWFLVSSIVFRANVYEIQNESNRVYLFVQTDHHYYKYAVHIKK